MAKWSALGENMSSPKADIAVDISDAGRENEVDENSHVNRKVCPQTHRFPHSGSRLDMTSLPAFKQDFEEFGAT
jgi:hypothetical protein